MWSMSRLTYWKQRWRQRTEALSETQKWQRACILMSVNKHQDAYGVESSWRALTTSSEVFAFDLLRGLHPIEHLRVLGWQNPNINGLSARQIRDLAGEAMAIPSVTLAVMCLLTSLPGFWKELWCVLGLFEAWSSVCPCKVLSASAIAKVECVSIVPSKGPSEHQSRPSAAAPSFLATGNFLVRGWRTPPLRGHGSEGVSLRPRNKSA